MDAILFINFGEPEAPDLDDVTDFLERIFMANARLDPASGPGELRRRARRMAEGRAPELTEAYRAMGGSPQNRQAAAQAERLEARLGADGRDARVLVGFQFTDPGIPAAIDRARELGARRVVALPVYPVSGPSTTLAALAETRDAVREADWDVPLVEISGWHGHPGYANLRADHALDWARGRGLDLADPDTRLVLCAHGTPLAYLHDGSRYDDYVRDHARDLAAALGVDRYLIGFQNHENRPGVEWTAPDIDRVLDNADADRVVVVPVSFMQEQSETMADLDIELRDAALDRGLDFHRVPVPHDDPRFTELLAGLLRPFLEDGRPGADGAVGRPCRCRPGARCWS